MWVLDVTEKKGTVQLFTISFILFGVSDYDGLKLIAVSLKVSFIFYS